MEIGVDEVSSISGLFHSLPSNVPWQTYDFISPHLLAMIWIQE